MASTMAAKGHVTIFSLLIQKIVLICESYTAIGSGDTLVLNPYTLNIQESLKHAWH